MLSYKGEELLSDEDKAKHFLWCYTVTSNYFKKNNFPNLDKNFFISCNDFFNKNFYFVEKKNFNLDKEIIKDTLNEKNDMKSLFFS